MTALIKWIGFPIFLTFMAPGAIAAQTADLTELCPEMDISGTYVRFIAFLLGISGSMYLAAVLWRKADHGSESWKYLSISMIMFVFWNIIMTFSILLDMLYISGSGDGSFPVETYYLVLLITKTLDPVIEAIVIIILFFGLVRIIKAMREEPWAVFSKEETNE